MLDKILVVFNPTAGGGKSKQIFEKFNQFCHENGLTFKVYTTQKANDVDGINGAAADVGIEIVSIFGGDGTLNDVVNSENCRAKKLHIVGSGSGNDFYRLLYNEISLQQSFEKIINGVLKPIDYGICNQKYFINGVGIGFDGQVAYETASNTSKFISGKTKYWLSILKNVLVYKSAEYTIKSEKDSINTRAFMISVANGTDYGGGFKVSPQSVPNDKYFNLIVINKMLPILRPFRIPLVEKGAHLNKTYVTQKMVKKAKISCTKEQKAHVDGEVLSGKVFEIEWVGQLNFLV
ncbi:MAG: YegS/Rv2252/BmrU family lipid kinase [Flavobacteriales bacterium]|nr:YegS/Rv2252/BmrU family lipid kinase [Flavobacteriales bacterium]